MSLRPRILAADTPQSTVTLRQLLEQHAELVPTGSIEEAVKHMTGRVDLILCDVHFAESRMYDLLRLAKADPATRTIPFLCFRNRDSALTPPVFEGLQIACQALGAVAFIDLYDLKLKYGPAEADALFKASILDLLDERDAEHDGFA